MPLNPDQDVSASSGAASEAITTNTIASSSGERQTARRMMIGLILLALISLGGYLAVSALTLRPGFPLDDAWIHQTYARNLGQLGEWSFIPGRPSAGSTAPAWSAMLAVGHALRLDPRVWAYLLGWMLLYGVSWMGMRLFRYWQSDAPGWMVWVGGFLILEWHLVWAAGSGMETLLLALLVLWVLGEVAKDRPKWWLVGVVIGFAAWARPDGITLLGPAGLAALTVEKGQRRIRAIAEMAGGTALMILPYLFFNRALAGTWWPNTFFAKQAEYAVLRQVPLWKRVTALGALPLIGPGAVLLPGAVWYVIKAFRQYKIAALGGLVWFVGCILIYAWRLPVTYQHGRYLIPAMPVYFIAGSCGMAAWVQLKSPQLFTRVLSRAWTASLVLVTLGFWIIGANAYAQDVAVIETEMVTSARWIAEKTPPDALVAAHDIGALGYFSRRNLIDLAGLVSPEVIPFIRDEYQLAEYLDEQGAEYLVTFPGWYPYLVTRGQLLYNTGARFSPKQGGENMAIYSWSKH